MLKIIQILFFFISITTFSQKVLDVVYLNNGSIVKGTIVKIVPNKDVKLTTDNGSVFIFKMSDIKEITKETQEEVINKEPEKEIENEPVIETQTNFNNDNNTVDENHGDDYVFEEKTKKKKKSKFWKSLGNFAVKVLDKAAENANNNTENETSTDNNPEIEGQNEEIYQDENSTREEEEEPVAMESVGTICFVNPNFYSRKVKLTKRNAYDTKQLIIGGTDKSCSYDLPVGVYSCKVYTTFTGKLVESFSLRIVDGEETSRKLNKNEFN